MTRATLALVLCASTASADPHPPSQPANEPTPPEKLPSTNPMLPIVTLSTMPITKTIPGAWDAAPRTDAWIATGAAGLLLATAIGWYFYRDRYTFVAKPATPGCMPHYTGGGDTNNCTALRPGDDDRAARKLYVWAYSELGLVTLSGAAVLVAASRWARHWKPARTIRVAPEHAGASVSVAGSF